MDMCPETKDLPAILRKMARDKIRVHISRLEVRVVEDLILEVQVRRRSPRSPARPGRSASLRWPMPGPCHGRSALTSWNRSWPGPGNCCRPPYPRGRRLPPGRWTSVISPGHGMKFFSGFSALILHSMAWPEIFTSSWVHARAVRRPRCGSAP